jgi:CheY-like chemotaxis protein
VKILVADDDPINRRLLQTSLARWNYEVILARDGQEAWNILQREDAPKLAILDWMMPGMDGPDICREVRKRNFKFYTYILLLTSNLRNESSQRRHHRRIGSRGGRLPDEAFRRE